MKCIESWLREWVNPKQTRDELAHMLTMAGLEVEELVKIETLNSQDWLIDLSITPNRGDCLSMKGVAREISALTKTPVKEISIPEVKATSQEVLPVKILDEAGCPWETVHQNSVSAPDCLDFMQSNNFCPKSRQLPAATSD